MVLETHWPLHPPRFSGDRAYIVAWRLVAISRSTTLDPAGSRARDELDAACHRLGVELGSALGDSCLPLGDARDAKKSLEKSWAAFHGFLVACAEIPRDEVADEARGMLKLLFPSKRAFLRGSPSELLTRSRRRLDAIGDVMADRINDLGGHHFLGVVELHHELLCVALAARVVSSGPYAVPACRKARVALNRAIGRYADSIGGATSPGNEASLIRARKLLAPLERKLRGKNRIAVEENEKISILLRMLRPKLAGERPS